jgi:hypothetical protein
MGRSEFKALQILVMFAKFRPNCVIFRFVRFRTDLRTLFWLDWNGVSAGETVARFLAERTEVRLVHASHRWRQAGLI